MNVQRADLMLLLTAMIVAFASGLPYKSKEDKERESGPLYLDQEKSLSKTKRESGQSEPLHLGEKKRLSSAEQKGVSTNVTSGQKKQLLNLPLQSADCDTGRDTSASGKKCNHHHWCDLHGESYFWCWTGALGDSWEYCCEPGMSCGFQGYNYAWCHAGSTWSQCNNICHK